MPSFTPSSDCLSGDLADIPACLGSVTTNAGIVDIPELRVPAIAGSNLVPLLDEVLEGITEVSNGTEGNDTLRAPTDSVPSILHGLAGNDVLYGSEQQDFIYGGAVQDDIYGGTG